LNTPDPERRKTIMDESNGVFHFAEILISQPPSYFISRYRLLPTIIVSLAKKAGGQLPQKL